MHAHCNYHCFQIDRVAMRSGIAGIGHEELATLLQDYICDGRNPPGAPLTGESLLCPPAPYPRTLALNTQHR
jgi:hypothetical protein